MTRKKIACYRWLDNLSQNKLIQFSGTEILRDFFKSKQPIDYINKYYHFFYTEAVYSKYLMVNEQYRDELLDDYPEIKNRKKYRWIIFKLFNIAYRFARDIP